MAILTALVVTSLAADPSPTRLVAAAVAAAVAYRTGRMWACLVAGMGVYWLLHLL